MTTVARLACDEPTARRLAAYLGEKPATTPSAPLSRTTTGSGRWRSISPRRPTRPRCARWLRSPPARRQPRRCHYRDGGGRRLGGAKPRRLAPVRAGRFIVHGAHDRARVQANDIGIEIEAALAFGTGHHGTTRGCLLALDALAKRRRADAHPRHRHRLRRAGDRGGEAAARARRRERHRPRSRSRPRAAMRGSIAPPRDYLRACRRHQSRAIAARAPYDLIFANILLGPLHAARRAAQPPRRARRAYRAVGPVAGTCQCRARDLSRAGTRARTAHSARRLGDAGAAVAVAAARRPR